MTLRGGCHCGAVRYETVGAPFHETLCYCRDCRLTSGAVAMAWFSVDRGSVRWTGTPASYASSPGVTRRFCPVCGATFTWERDGSDEVDLSTATLDAPDAMPPKDHLFVASKPDWAVIGDDLPQHAGRRETG